jgi:hypothetical protein
MRKSHCGWTSRASRIVRRGAQNVNDKTDSLRAVVGIRFVQHECSLLYQIALRLHFRS